MKLLGRLVPHKVPDYYARRSQDKGGWSVPTHWLGRLTQGSLWSVSPFADVTVMAGLILKPLSLVTRLPGQKR